MESFVPHHINARAEDLAGNAGCGRYIFLTGSDERAREISEHFNDVSLLRHPRQHNLYLGTLTLENNKIDVASIATGMGGPSADIIINELIMCGAKRFLRVGTAGSLQPNTIKVGDVVIATGAVRDDKASWDYIYKEYPAIPSINYVIAAGRAAQMQGNLKTHFGIVHSKSSLFAREYQFSFLPENKDYMKCLYRAGVLASEMECAQLFILSSLMNAQSGSILAIVGDKTSFSNRKKLVITAINSAILLAIETTKQIALIDKNIKSVF